MAGPEETFASLIVRSSPAPSVTVLAFNRPSKRNALSQALIDEFISELDKASQDDLIKAIIVTGTRDSFSGLLPASSSEGHSSGQLRNMANDF